MFYFSALKNWGTVITAHITPLKKDGSICYDTFSKMIYDNVTKQNATSIIVSGTTGESPTLSKEEKLNLLRTAKDTLAGKASVLIGAGSNNTEETLHFIKAIEKVGADGIMLVNPYYNKPGQKGLEAHYSFLAASTSLPVMLYNIPGRTSMNMNPETLFNVLEKCPNVVALKESAGDLDQASYICTHKPENFTVYSGDDSLTLPYLCIGAEGVVSVASHVAGADIYKMIEVFTKNPRESLSIHQKLLPIFQILFKYPSPGPVKYVLSLLGYDCEKMRLPMVGLSSSEKKEVYHAIQYYIQNTEVFFV